MKIFYRYLAIAVISYTTACNTKDAANKTTQQTGTHTNSNVEKANKSSKNMALFFQSALEGDLEQVTAAIEVGVDVNTYDENKHTALMLAAYNGHHHIIKALINKGANVALVDEMNRTALMFASTGPFPQAVKMLIDAGAEVNAIDNKEKWTPVMIAAAEGQLEVVKILVANDADLKMVDIDGESSLDFAKSNGHTEVVNYIISQLK